MIATANCTIPRMSFSAATSIYLQAQSILGKLTGRWILAGAFPQDREEVEGAGFSNLPACSGTPDCPPPPWEPPAPVAISKCPSPPRLRYSRALTTAAMLPLLGQADAEPYGMSPAGPELWRTPEQ